MKNFRAILLSSTPQSMAVFTFFSLWLLCCHFEKKKVVPGIGLNQPNEIPSLFCYSVFQFHIGLLYSLRLI